MKEISYKSGDIIHKAGDIADTLDFISSGKITIKADNFSINAKKGNVIGILEQAGTPYSYDYIALDDVTVLVYPFTRFSDVNQIVEDHFDECDSIITATANLVISLSSKYRQLKKAAERFYSGLSKQYTRYKELCGIYGAEIQSFSFLETTSQFVPYKDMPDWINDYYDQLEIMPRDTKNIFFGTHSSLTTASIWEAASHAKMFLSLFSQINEYANGIIYEYFNSPKADLFDLLNNLVNKCKLNDVQKRELKYEIKECISDLLDDWDGNILISEEALKNKRAAYKDLLADDMESGEYSSKKPNKDEFVLDATIARYALIEDSLDTILKYAQTDEYEDDRFRLLVSEYKSLKDKNSSQDSVVELKKEITKSFFDIYESAIISSFDDNKKPTILMMFFYFGYIDEDLIGKENALFLYDLAEKMAAIQFDEASNVYTIYDWLRAIYQGKEEPSKNELDLDFPAYLKSQKVSGYITAETEARYLKSPREKLRFEIQNFFKTTSRACSGRPSTFCPILSNHNIVKPLDSMYVTAEAINKIWDMIKSIDYSVFYRTISFQSKEHHIFRESIMYEVVPKTILVPTIGSKALLWQETADLRRDTPGRIAMPIFTEEDLLLLQMKLAGEFRWEMCKRIQGARWNNIAERSLTSDYFDYLQFYKKNSSLSPDAKDKIRTQISNYRNNFKNIFIADYILWVRHESLGSPRLNKVVKNIMFTYCPFSKAARDRLRNNPMYTDMISRHELRAAKNLKNILAHYSKLSGTTTDLPNEVLEHFEYYKK